MNFKVLFVLLLMIGFVGLANAVDDYDRKTITTMGIVENGDGYFRIAETGDEGWEIDCSGAEELMYYNFTTDFGKMVHSTLLAAKLSGKGISRIVYSSPENSNICSVALIEIEK